ncbi:hypothetical protein T05_4190 [Trichinella murrelli]|uniref:Uncharacterized protein n=1 Tax=Trichinella murrelli TaxID=144512 RepID=A0A0V0U3R0_9BILA|nr:hypothetical protein T05_4190 [Trichinella murrelli]
MKTSENNKQNTKAVTRKEIAISGTAVGIQIKNVPWKYYAILKFLQIFAGLIWRAVHYTSRNLYTKAGHVDCPNSRCCLIGSLEMPKAIVGQLTAGCPIKASFSSIKPATKAQIEN